MNRYKAVTICPKAITQRGVGAMVSWRMAESRDRNMSREDAVCQLKEILAEADTVIVGAGAGLTASAGFQYKGKRFWKYFRDFAEKYHFRDMYAGSFFHFPAVEEYWAYWSRYAYISRYMDAQRPVYRELLELVHDKDYFVITTNVNHAFQKAGWDSERLLCLNGDFGLFQCSRPCSQDTYENEEIIRRMVVSQGYEIGEAGALVLPEGRQLKMFVPPELHPCCPHCGRPMRVNLRMEDDDTFVKDQNRKQSEERYHAFLQEHRERKTLFLELGVSFRIPAAIKYNFWRMAEEWPDASYACVNLRETYAPDEIRHAVCVRGDIGETLRQLKTL